MELAGIEPASKHIATNISTLIVLLFFLTIWVAAKLAFQIASLMISYKFCRRKNLSYPTEMRALLECMGDTKTLTPAVF